MKFVDQATIYVQSGHGGPGSVSFRREKFVPKGGPDGGDGGRGGDVVLVADSQKDTLFRFHMNQHFQAENGRPGEGRHREGRRGLDVEIPVPPGTVVHDAETGDVLWDLIRPGDRYVAARGGRGGKGNAHFTSSTHRTPRMAQPGEPGESLRLRLELKLLADVGLVGLPNAGKSTLISHLSAARPKIADYPFTTLIPNLGVVDAGEGRSFVLADIPGLIAGASQGAGLGHRFLRHIQRCRVLVHLLDAGRIDPETPLADYRTVTDELEAFDKGLLAKVQVVAVNKMDLDVGQAAHEAVTRALEGRPVFAISGATGFGLKDLKYALWGLLQALPVPAGDEADADDEEDSDDV